MDKNNIKLENNGTFITMRYELVPGEQIDDNVMERLNNNILEGVGKVQVTEVDSKKVIFSQIPVSVDLESYFKKTLTKPEVLTILKNLVAGFDIGKNGIPVGYIVKDFKYIYIDENTLNTYEFVVPIKGNTTDVSEIPEFFKKCVAGMKFHENDRDNYVAKIITKLNSDMFSLNDFNVMINEMLLEVGMSEMPAAGNMGSKVDKVGVLRNRAGQVPPMPQPGMGQPTPMPQPGMGQIPPRPQQGMGQVPPMPQPGMGQIPPRPNQGMAQLSPIPQSGMAPVPPVPPQGMGQIPPMPQPVKRFDPMTGKPIEEPPASQPIPVAQPVKRFDPMTGKPIEEPKAEEPAPAEEPKIEESKAEEPKAELPKTESPLTGPAPQPVPGPAPQPVPGPIPQPVPGPIPQPVPSSIPQPVQSSIPQPVPSPIPQPVQSSIPQPVPSSIPQPAPGPIPTPGPMPQPVKRFDPMTGKPIEEPKTETPAPVEEPKAEAPAPAEEPKAEEPAPAEEPKAEAPVPAEEPKTEEPAPAEEPKAEEPVPTEEPEKKQDSNVNPGLGGVEELDELNLEDIDDELANSVKNIDPAPAPSNKPETKFDPMTGMPLSRSVQPMQSKPAPGPGPVPTPAPQPQQVNIVKPEAAQPPKQDVSKPHPHFVREKTGEKIYIDKDEFKIGKSKVHADYAIENNSAISRVHVIIIKRNGVSYLKDNDSTNGTFVDGARVNPGAEVLLKANMRVKFGNEDFTFLLRDEV